MLHLMLLYMCSDFTRRSIFLGGPHHLTKYMALLPAWFMWKIEKPAWYENSVSSGFEITIQFCVIETWLKQWSSAHEVILLLTLFSSLANRQHLCPIQQFASVNTTLVFQSFFPHEGRLQLYVLCWTMWTKNAMLLPNLDANKAAIKTSFFEVRITT